MSGNEQYITKIVRTESGKLLSILLNHTRDIQLAEDALQDAFIQAMATWPEQGQPNNPQGWLLTVARRHLIDRFRRDSRHNHEKNILSIIDCLHSSDETTEADHPIPDERLKLIFTCCHPSLSEQAQTALTLKTLCGLSAREIARAYLVSEVTMNQRLTRAKQKIKKAGIAYKVPETDNLEERLPSVLSVIYLIFNESYTAFEGKTLTRQDLANEAIRLAKVLYRLLPRPDIAGLLCLVLLHNSRRAARSNQALTFITLEKQDRSLWDQTEIEEARTLLLRVMSEGKPDQYQIQAAISALHAQAQDWVTTDWTQIILLYDELYKLNPSPVVKLNQSVALANSGNKELALVQINKLEEALKDYQPFYAARADLARQLSKIDLAIQSYQKAISMSKNAIERDYLMAQKSSL
ncbi:MAG: RNA polymerase sigma-70 factor (ECF subfamily) [Gammaproteobacteria bacterium]|jgi:RNA polymerase sigma-70 factor (ECF subfamily)